MKYLLWILLTFITAFALLEVPNASAAITFPVNGGTGSSTLTGILVGNGTSPVNSLIVGSGLNLTGTTLSTTGGSSASSTLLTDNNTFQGIDNFTNASSNFSGTLGGDSLATILASAFSTTSANYWLTLNTGNAFSTTSANYWGANTSTNWNGTWQTFSPAHFLTSTGIESTSTNPFMATYFVATSTTQASSFPYASSTAMTASGTVFANNFYDTSLSGNTCVSESSSLIVGSTYCVTSVGATWPLASSGGTNPIISSATSSGSSAGVLSAADWTTFNGKQSNLSLAAGTYVDGDGCTYASSGTLLNCNTALHSGTVTSVALSAPSLFSVSGSPVTTSGTLTLAYNGTALPIANGGTDQTSFTGTNALVNFDGTHLSSPSTSYTLSSSLLTAPNASTTNLTANLSQVVGDGSGASLITPLRGLSVTYATSTAWTGSSTVLDIGVAPFGMTINTARCHTDAGTLNVQLQYGTGPTKPAMLFASSTIGQQTLSSSNTPAKGNDIEVQFGTPASSPTTVNCTFSGPQTST